jgi:hypothetical protein
MSGRFFQRVTRDNEGRVLSLVRVDRVTGDERELPLSKLSMYPDEEPGDIETKTETEDGGSPVDNGFAIAEDATADYAVGYKRPPRSAAFKPGQSGNPKGRPKGQSLRSIFLSAAADGMERDFAEFVGADPSGTKLEAAITALFRKSHYGDAGAIKQVLALQREFVAEERENADE